MKTDILILQLCRNDLGSAEELQKEFGRKVEREVKGVHRGEKVFRV